jgi:transposase InsO family protein
MCDWLRVSRLSFYRYWQEKAPAEEETALRDQLQLLCVANPSYGSRRLAQLLKRAGENVNRKRVQRMMHEDNLLCLRGKKFVVTTDSKHAWGFYPNRARDMTLTNVNQLWVADITYIRLREEFAYLAVVLDAFSRRIIGWALEPHIRSELAMAALIHALRDRIVPPGLIHHSDRGVQYCCGDYIHLLQQYDIRPSMSRKGNPYDNAKAESFMKTLKFEQVDGRVYASIDEARQHIIPFLECYNQQRLHSALNYRSPREYEADLLLPRDGWNEGAGI